MRAQVKLRSRIFPPLLYFQCMAALLAALLAPLAAGYAVCPFFARRAGIRSLPRGLLFHSLQFRRRLGFSHFRAERFDAIINTMASQGIAAARVQDAADRRPDGSPAQAVIAFDDGFADFYEAALPALRTHGFHVSVFPVVQYIGAVSSWDVFPPLRHLTADQIRDIAGAGHEIGSHTLTHADCTRLNARDLDRELGDSKMRLEDIAGVAVTSLSFPCGRWNGRVWQRAQELGYRAATVYTRVLQSRAGMIPLAAAYAFDTADDLLARIGCAPHSAISSARGWIMPHFAKGTSLYRWRKEYLG